MFRSVKNWLTILILALVALAMIVAWAYVVPPLANRLDQLKLVDQRGNAKLTSDTVIQWIADRASLEYWVGRLSMRLNARVVVLTGNQVVRYDTLGAGPADVGDYPMIAEALTSAKVLGELVPINEQQAADLRVAFHLT